MMDSQDNILEQEVKEEAIQETTVPEVETQEVAPVAEEEAPAAEEVAPAAEEVAPVAEEEAPIADPELARKVYETKKEVLDRIKEIAHGDETPQKEEIDYLKTSFYKLHIAEREANLKAYIDGGGDPDAYQITPDEDEEVFKAEMGIIKEKRAKLFKEQEAEKLVNLEKKLAIIEKIKRPDLFNSITFCPNVSCLWNLVNKMTAINQVEFANECLKVIFVPTIINL